MSVTNTSIKTPYLGNGVTTAFSTNFPVAAFTDVNASLTGTSGIYNCVYGTDFTVSGAVTSSAVTVTFTTAPASGIDILIYRVEPLTQVNNFVDNARWTGEAVTGAFDKLTMIAQQLQDQSNRSIQFPIADTGSATNILPPVAQRAGMIMAFDQSGDPVAVTRLGTWRGSWTTATTYYYSDTFQDPATGSLYFVDAQPSYISGTAVAADLAAGYLVRTSDMSSITANVGSAASSAAAAQIYAANAGSSASGAAASATSALSSASLAAANAGSSASSAVASAASAATASANAGSAASSAATAASYIPSNSGQSGKYLTNNGTANSWGSVANPTTDTTTNNFRLTLCELSPHESEQCDSISGNRAQPDE